MTDINAAEPSTDFLTEPAYTNGHTPPPEPEPPVAVAPPTPPPRLPVLNQNLASRPDATVSFKLPQQALANAMGANTGVGRQIYAPRNGQQRMQSDADFLDALLLQPNSLNWNLRVDRFLPPVTRTGEPVPSDDLLRLKVMPMSSLKEQIIKAWGGGEYRVSVVYENGDVVPLEEIGLKRCTITVSVNQSQHPPKLQQYAGNEENGLSVDPALKKTPREIELAKEMEELELENRSLAQKLKIRSSRAKLVLEERRVEEVENAAWGTSAKSNEALEALQAQILSIQAKTQEEQAKAEERRRDDLAKAEERRREDAKEAETRRREDAKIAEDRRERDNQLFRESFNMLAQSIKAVAERPIPAPLPDRSTDLVIALNQSQSTLMGQLLPVLMKKEPAPPDKSTELAIEVIKAQSANQQALAQTENKYMTQIIECIRAPQADRLGTKEVIDLMNTSSRQTIELLRNNMPEEESSFGGWQQALVDIAKEAVKNPIIGQLCMKIFNTMNPTAEQIEEMAAQMQAANGGVQQFAQQPILPPVQPVNNMPPPLPNPGQPQQVRPVYAVPQAPKPTGPVRPVYAPPQQMAPVQQLQPVAPVQQPAQAMAMQGEPDLNDPAVRLVMAVSDSIELCADSIEDRTKGTLWVDDADNHWPENFKFAMLMAADNDARAQLISRYCKPESIKRLSDLFRRYQNLNPDMYMSVFGTQHPTQNQIAELQSRDIMRFYLELNQFVARQEHLRPRPAQPVQTPMQPQAPVQQAPVQAQSVQAAPVANPNAVVAAEVAAQA